MTDLVLFSTPADGVVLLTLNRPEARNALSQELRDAFVMRLEAAEADPAVRVIVVTGNDKAFVAGADLKAMSIATPESMAASRSHHIWEAFARTKKPIIAAVRGYALGGGCEFAMACDMIVAADTAIFGQPEIKVGVMAGAGGIARLIRRIGGPRTVRLSLTGEMISGAQAYQWGMVSECVPEDQTLDRALDMAATIAAFPAGSARAIKQAARLSEELPLTEALKAERDLFLSLLATPDQREGAAAFLEKRKPNFNAG